MFLFNDYFSDIYSLYLTGIYKHQTRIACSPVFITHATETLFNLQPNLHMAADIICIPFADKLFAQHKTHFTTYKDIVIINVSQMYLFIELFNFLFYCVYIYASFLNI